MNTFNKSQSPASDDLTSSSDFNTSLAVYPHSPAVHFDSVRVGEAIAANITEALTSSDDVWRKISSVQLSAVPIITYRIDVTITPKI